MARLLGGGARLSGTTGTSAIFITLPTAQPSLGQTPSTTTGFTLVTGLNGQLGFTSTLGGIYFQDGVVRRINSGTNLIIESNGTGTVQLNGNVLFNGKSLQSLVSTLTNLTSENLTVTNLTVTGGISFTSATTTATFAGNVIVRKDLRVDRQLDVRGNVSLNPDGGIVEIKPALGGTVQIGPSDTGRMDNMNIGDLIPANGRFINLTATNFTVSLFSATNFAATTGTFDLINANNIRVTNSLTAGQVYDSGLRVIRQITAGTDTVVVSTASGLVEIWNISTLQSVVARGNTSSNPIRITSANSATNQSTGALIVDGGVGIGGSVYAGNIFDNGSRVITSATVVAGVGLSGGGTLTGPNSRIALTNTGVLSLIAGTDTRVSTATGNVTVWNASTLQTVTDRGWTTTNYIHIQNGFSQIGTGSNLLGGTWTDAVFVVDGDAGIGGNLYINGNFYANGKSVLTTSSVGGAITGGVDILVVTNTGTGELTFNDTATLQSVTNRGSTTTNKITFANTVTSTSTNSGAIVVAGGIGVNKDVFVGGAVYAQDGGSPAYNYKIYTPRVTVSTSTPVGSRIGDFWIDPSIGVEYQYVPNGTQTVWIQFIGF
jgi:hypothetical protein